MEHYIFEEGEVRTVSGDAEWIAFLNRQAGEDWRRVLETRIEGARVSTVFVMINHGGEPPVLFETMIFWDNCEEVAGDEEKLARDSIRRLSAPFPLDEYQERYSTLEEARAGHARAVAAVEEVLKGKVEHGH